MIQNVVLKEVKQASGKGLQQSKDSTASVIPWFPSLHSQECMLSGKQTKKLADMMVLF